MIGKNKARRKAVRLLWEMSQHVWQLSDVFALCGKLQLITAMDHKSQGRGEARGTDLGSQFDVLSCQVWRFFFVLVFFRPNNTVASILQKDP